MNLLYNTNFKFPSEELKRYPDFMDSDSSHQQDDLNSGHARYFSAPEAFTANLTGETEGIYSGPQEETIISRFMASCNGSASSGETPAEQESGESFRRQYGYRRRNEAADGAGAPIGSSSGDMGSASVLFRQSSSPAAFFSRLTAENDFTTTRDDETYATCSRKNAESFPPSSLIGNHLGFSGQASGSRHMPPIAEESNKTSDNSWNIRHSKRSRHDDNNGHPFSTSIAFQTPNAGSRNGTHGLTHHLSLPASFSVQAPAEAPAERFLTFQEPIAHQIRARRGFATHPRSIAERMRRARISERMRKLQELFPDMDKQTSTADMLDLAVEYIKGLQRQLKTLRETKERCICSNK